MENNFSEPQNHRKLNISRNIKNFPHTVLKILSAQISWTDIFFEKHFFHGLGAFFTTEKPLIWAPFFPTKN